ncbi:helix-turn-helix domain-containing protein [Streptomyces sp. MMCC 100]|uniref:helix-turn-helix domain-containing protein n=1 Tax=Streptomyces sp. MMCC 100 TaxID=3163555 RepID=UPI003598F55F
MVNLLKDATPVIGDAHGACTATQRLSTLSGLNFPVLFILMTDKRESTQANGDAEVSQAARLRRKLGRRLRLARVARGLSQQGVADAMKAYGFNWVQTTVAKTEGADRPAQFVEVVALADVLGRDIGFFLSGRTDLDRLKDEIAAERAQNDREVEVARQQLMTLEARGSDIARAQLLALAITAYTYDQDVEELRKSLETIQLSFYSALRASGRVLDAAKIPRRIVDEIDRSACVSAAQALLEANGEMKGVHFYRPVQVGPEVDGRRRYRSETLEAREVVKLAKKVVEGGEVSNYFLTALRGTAVWGATAQDMFVRAVVRLVEPRDSDTE